MTDDLNPEKLIKKYEKEFLDYDNISFGYKNLGVIEDFFSIQKFDCIIRGDSTFSIVASLLGDMMITISVVEAVNFEGENLVLKSNWEINTKHEFFNQP
jgi:hypothetical protein